MKPRVVFDTNVLISAILFEGVPAQGLNTAREKQITLLLSPAIFAEFQRKLAKKFERSLEEIQSRTTPLMNLCELIQPTSHIALASRDPDDNRILECAVSGRADIIVTGDKDLLVLHPFQGIQVLTPRQFLDTLTVPLHTP